jgi:hypothetical protein
MNRIVGTREFADGSQRAVYEDGGGRQFVIGDDGRAVYGVWLLSDEPTRARSLCEVPEREVLKR